jgi:hypothetical protein
LGHDTSFTQWLFTPTAVTNTNTNSLKFIHVCLGHDTSLEKLQGFDFAQFAKGHEIALFYNPSQSQLARIWKRVDG